MNIDKKLQEIRDYFCDKLIDGDYKFIKCNEYTAEILIDEKYKFSLWIANTPKISFNFYDSFSFIENNLNIRLTTQKQRIKAWNKIKPYVTEYKNKALKREKQKELNRLKKELAILESNTE